MSGSEALHELPSARSNFEANVILAVLRSAGIPAYGDSGDLMDEVAISRVLMNTGGVRIFVPADRAEDAKKVLAAAKAAGERLETDSDDGEPAEPTTGRGTSKWAWMFAATTALFFLLWVNDHQKLVELSEANPLFDVEYVIDDSVAIMVERWKDNGNVAARYHDHDANLHFERIDGFDRQGRKLYVSRDKDQDGVVDIIEGFDRNGRLLDRWTDSDGDGRPDHGEIFHADGARVVMTDLNNDEIFERRECYDSEDRLVSRHDDLGMAGVVEVK